MDEAGTADHAFLGGRLRLREPRRGHRSGTDAVLLAAAARLAPGQHLIDVGAGAGAAALAALARVEGTTATLIERDPQMAELARHNAEANGFGDRVTVVAIDVFGKAARRELPRAGDVVISNPPFYLAGSVRASPEPQRAASHVLLEGHHGDWLRCLFDCAAPRGRTVVIHRPEALPELMATAGGRGAITLRGIHPRADKPATRILVDVLMNRRSPLAMAPALFLHEADGSFTALAEALHRGEADL